MATDKEIRQAQNVYKTACDVLDDMGWVYNKDESILEIYTGAAGDDYPISIRICVEPEKNLVTLLLLQQNLRQPYFFLLQLLQIFYTYHHAQTGLILLATNFDILHMYLPHAILD
jgi:hypothetical protein